MKFDTKLQQGIFLKRYKRFFADINLAGKTVTAHVANTGSLKTCNDPGSPCLVSYTDDPNRKLKYTLQMIKTPTSWVGVNTSLPNKLVQELFQKKLKEDWKTFDSLQTEVKISTESRIDLVVWKKSDHPEVISWKPNSLKPKMRLIEVKNVTMSKDGVSLFPDAVTERGQKHLLELMSYMKRGFECELVFVIQREDCKTFSPCDEIDSEYGKLLRKAKLEGLIISPLTCKLSDTEIILNPNPISLDL